MCIWLNFKLGVSKNLKTPPGFFDMILMLGRESGFFGSFSGLNDWKKFTDYSLLLV